MDSKKPMEQSSSPNLEFFLSFGDNQEVVQYNIKALDWYSSTDTKTFKYIQHSYLGEVITCLNNSDLHYHKGEISFLNRFHKGIEHVAYDGYFIFKPNSIDKYKKIVIKFRYTKENEKLKINIMTPEQKQTLEQKYTKMKKYLSEYEEKQFVKLNNSYIFKSNCNNFFWIEDYVEDFHKFGGYDVLFAGNITLLKLQKFIFEKEERKDTIIDLQGGVTDCYILCDIEFITTVNYSFSKEELIDKFDRDIERRIDSYEGAEDKYLKQNMYSLNEKVSKIEKKVDEMSENMYSLNEKFVKLEEKVDGLSKTMSEEFSSIRKMLEALTQKT